MARGMPIVALADMVAGQEADLFALMSAKEALVTRDGKPYWKVSFRDARREVTFPIWADSPLAADCREAWTPGAFYKLRAIYRETNFGPQLDIIKIREATDADRSDGFDPMMCQPQSRRPPREMYDQLRGLVEEHIADATLRQFVASLLEEHVETLLVLPAATRNHHAYVGGFLEHVVSVTQNCVLLAEKYARQYADLEPPLDKDLVVAGGVLHDIGKVRELEVHPAGAVYSVEGALVGHLLQGRDMIREAAARIPLDADVQLRLEHIVLSHQRLPEWGSPKPPMTPEALLVHYADDLDAKFQMMYEALRADNSEGPLTSKANALRQQVYRGTVAR